MSLRVRLACATGLLKNEGAVNVVGNSNAAGLRERFRICSVIIERQISVPGVLP